MSLATLFRRLGKGVLAPFLLASSPRSPQTGVLTAIAEVNEALALSHDRRVFLNMVLDAVVEVLGTECCWVQTFSQDGNLPRLTGRGLNPAMETALTSTDGDHAFRERVVGLGEKVVISDLSRDGASGLEPFRKAGLQWVVAVPLMTYRCHGLMGIASRERKFLKRETPELAQVIAGLIGTALHWSELPERGGAGIPRSEKVVVPQPEKLAAREPGAKEEPPAVMEFADPFLRHVQLMEAFRRSHPTRH